uniref:CCHC-type domain-containing protein n=1 Tax=Caenorhabditis japonica TaxID=281687 RepID=A0A8R1E530_CAEJA
MEDNESEVMKVEMALDVLDGTRTSGTKGSELSVEKRHVGVKQRRKLFKNFARFVDTADEVEKKVMENLLSVQSCTERHREMIVAPIEEFRKELWERFEEIGRDKWPRAVLRLMREQKLETVEELRELCERGSLEDRSSRKEGEENHQEELIRLKAENERLEARIREFEAEKLRAEKLMRRAQRAVEEERKTAEELSGRLQKVSRELERLRRYGRTNQCFRCGGVGHVVRQCTSRPVQKVDTAKKARKAKMVESVKLVGQRRRFEIDSGSVVSVTSTGGWGRSKRRSTKWEKEVEVLAKPNFRGPPQSGVQGRAKAKAGLGQFIRMETEKQCEPTSLRLKSEEKKVTGVVSNPLYIKRNQGIGVGSRSATRCLPKAAQRTVDTVDMMSQEKIRWVPREKKRLVQKGAKKGKREERRQSVNCAGESEKCKFSVENTDLCLRRTLEDRHGGLCTVKPDRVRLLSISLSASEPVDSMECLVDCRDMAVPEHESVTNRQRSRSRSGNSVRNELPEKESLKDVDTLLRARARRLERRRHVSADK